MNEVGAITRDLFLLALILILAAYFAGTTAVGKTFFAGLNQILLTSTGQKAGGGFNAYPANAPHGGA